jgi:hypothetical protein
MTDCRDFEKLWAERLDERERAAPDLVARLETHAASCARCQALGARFQALAQAIRALGPVPTVSEVFPDRVLAEMENARWWPRLLPIMPVAAAAVLVVALTIGVRVWWTSRPAAVVPPLQAARVQAIDARDLTSALVDATSATWQLAQEASAPAARLGRQVLEASTSEDPPLSLSLPSGVTADLVPGVESWQAVGERMNAGLRPLSGTARQAFGFLLGPSAAPANPVPRTPRGT